MLYPRSYLPPLASWLPEPDTTFMRVLVRSSKCMWRKSSKPSDVSTAQYHVVCLQPALQFCNHVEHTFGPFLLSSPFKGGVADVVLERLSILIWQVCQLHGLEYSVHNQS